MSLDEVLQSLRRGEFVLLHDGNTRENEVDMVVAADFITPEHIARMRRDAGGLICLSVGNSFARDLGLRYMHDILASPGGFDAESRDMIIGRAPYGDRPSFSISINHRDTYTGVTDADRALTMSEMAKLYKTENGKRKGVFTSSFRTPGHVPVLIASEGLLSDRLGHTEMSVYLATLAGLSPVTVICEMLDSQTHGALSPEKARQYARENSVQYFDGSALVEYAKGH